MSENAAVTIIICAAILGVTVYKIAALFLS